MIKDVFVPSKIGSYYIFHKRVLGFEVTTNSVQASLVYFSRRSVILENSMNTFQANIEKEAQDRALQQAAQVVIDRSNAAMKFIISFNMSKISTLELDSAGLDALEVMFSEALTKIQNMRPDKAADLIEALDITGTVYTEVERVQLVNILRGL